MYSYVHASEWQWPMSVQTRSALHPGSVTQLQSPKWWWMVCVVHWATQRGQRPHLLVIMWSLVPQNSDHHLKDATNIIHPQNCNAVYINPVILFGVIKCNVHMILHHSAGSIPDHPTSFKLTWDLEIGVSLVSIIHSLFCIHNVDTRHVYSTNRVLCLYPIPLHRPVVQLCCQPLLLECCCLAG